MNSHNKLHTVSTDDFYGLNASIDTVSGFIKEKMKSRKLVYRYPEKTERDKSILPLWRPDVISCSY